MLAFSVQSTGRFIKQQNRGFADECPRDCNPLLLTSRKSKASFTNNCIVTLREKFFIFNKGECICLTAGFIDQNLKICLRKPCLVDAIHDVFSNGTRKENGLLLDKSNLLLVIPLVVQLFDVFSLVAKPAGKWIIETFN